MANEALSTLAALALLPGLLALATALLAALFAYEGDADIRALGAALSRTDFRTRDPKVVRALRAALPIAERLAVETGLLPAATVVDRAPTFATKTAPNGRRKDLAA